MYYNPVTLAHAAEVQAALTSNGKCSACGYQLIRGWCSSCDMACFVQERDREEVDMKATQPALDPDDVQDEMVGYC
jgi:hypothetical protein